MRVFLLPLLALVAVGCASTRPAPVVPVATPAPAATIDLAAEGRALNRLPWVGVSVFDPSRVIYVPPLEP